MCDFSANKISSYFTVFKFLKIRNWMKPRIVTAKNKIIQITTSDVTYVGLLDCYQSIFRLHNNWWLMLETMFQPRPSNLDWGNYGPPFGSNGNTTCESGVINFHRWNNFLGTTSPRITRLNNPAPIMWSTFIHFCKLIFSLRFRKNVSIYFNFDLSTIGITPCQLI